MPPAGSAQGCHSSGNRTPSWPGCSSNCSGSCPTSWSTSGRGCRRRRAARRIAVRLVPAQHLRVGAPAAGPDGAGRRGLQQGRAAGADAPGGGVRSAPGRRVPGAGGSRGRCGGRRSRIATGLTSAEVIDEPTEEVYHSRRYRLRPGQQFGPVDRGVIGVVENDGYAVLVFPHDADTFTVTFTRLPQDKALASLRTVDAFEAVARTVPLTAEWTDPERAQPVSGVMVMAGLRNTFRPPSAAAPMRLHALGDAVCTTNPHFGRGSSLAVAHAIRLGRAVDLDPTDPSVWRTVVDGWVEDELWSWFDDARRLDRARAAAWQEAVAGGRPTAPAASLPDPGPGPLPRELLLAAAGEDLTISLAVIRYMHMVDRPAQLTALEPRVSDLLA